MGRVKNLLKPFDCDQNNEVVLYFKILEEDNWIEITEIVEPCGYFDQECIHVEFEYENLYGYDSRCGLTVKARKLPPIEDGCPNCNEKWEDINYPCECVSDGTMRNEWKQCYQKLIKNTKEYIYIYNTT